MSKLNQRIISRWQATGLDTVNGRYTYHFSAYTGEILRCLTREVGQTWFAPDGALCDGWQVVATL